MERIRRYLHERIPCNVDKIKLLFHVTRHAPCIACQFLPNILFKSCPTPPPHLLNLRVRIPCKGKSIGPSTPEGVCVYALNPYSFSCWILKLRCRVFQGAADMLHRGVSPCIPRPVRRQKRLRRPPVLMNVKELSTQGSDRAKVFLAIRLLIDADALLAILLVIQLQRCTIRRSNQVCRCIRREAP
jgi:hypothetical protein